MKKVIEGGGREDVRCKSETKERGKSGWEKKEESKDH